MYATMAVDMAPTNISLEGHPTLNGDMEFHVSANFGTKIHPWSITPVGLDTSPSARAMT
jgi:hypothetical protein